MLLTFLNTLATIISVISLLIVTYGVLVCFIAFLRNEIKRFNGTYTVNNIRQLRADFGTYLLLGLEFLIASDILKTVVDPTLDELAILGGVVSFLKFAQQVIVNSDRKPGTKDNMLGTVATLKEFRNVIEFTDINYTFLKEFDAFLRNKGLKVNTVGKHMRILRTLVNEAINEGYILQEAYPFRKFKIKREKKEHNFLMPADLEKLERLELPDRKNNSRHILDAFLFCCYCGLRFSDFKQLTCKNLVTVDGKEWLVLNSVKTGVKLNIPLYLLFNGKALGIMRKYDSIEQLAALGCNSDTNRTLQKLGRMAHIGKKFTYHTSRHTCATLLVHQGVPITTVQKLLGHTSVKTTEIYSEVFDETIIKDLTRANQKYYNRRNVKQNQIKSQKYSEKYLRQ